MMGGFGSGRKSEVICTDVCQSIDIRHWQREGNLVPGNHFIGQSIRNGKKMTSISVKVEVSQLRLTYTHQRNSGISDNVDYPVRLEMTSCHYGGVRYWFTCPADGCGRRVAILYRDSGCKYFACRHCYQFAYQSQRETANVRADRKANKIKVKLSWPRGIYNPIGGKPKSMHWKTYYRLLTEHNDYLNQALLGVSEKLLCINKTLRKIEKQMYK